MSLSDRPTGCETLIHLYADYVGAVKGAFQSVNGTTIKNESNEALTRFLDPDYGLGMYFALRNQEEVLRKKDISTDCSRRLYLASIGALKVAQLYYGPSR